MRGYVEPAEDDLVALAQCDPDDLIAELDRLDSEHSLRAYMELAWPTLEPGRRFMSNWHIDCISEHLEAVSDGEITRILFNLPPGGMKSLTTDAMWPSWEWGPRNRPELRYLSASYSLDLTVRDNRRCRTLIQSAWYQRLWGDRFRLVSDQNAKTRFDNDKMGYKIATSVGGLGAGERADRAIIDDPHNILGAESTKIRNEALLWFSETMPTRMSDPLRSAIVVIAHRTHEADVSGFILEKELGYVHVMIPMEFEPARKCFVEVTGWSDPRTEENELMWPERFTREIVERDKKVMGEYAVAGQLQQRPAPRGGGMFKRTWWRFYRTGHPTRPPDCDESVPAVELPSTFDQSLVTVDANFKLTKKGSHVGMLAIGAKGPWRYVLACRTRATGFNGAIESIVELLKLYPFIKTVIVEDKANGSAIIETLSNVISGVVAVNPEGGKEARASSMEPAVRSGHWVLPEGAPWVDEFITQFGVFPSSARNDNVDAASQAAIFLNQSVSVTRALNLFKM